MKKILCVLSVLFLCAAAGCSGQTNEESDLNNANSEETRDINTDEISVDISDIVGLKPSAPESSEESSKEPSYPDGITQKKSGTLEFRSKSEKVISVFSDTFSEIDTDSEPGDGIFLQTHDGKATLLLDFVENNGITQDDLVNYLKDTYSTEPETDGDDTVICKIDALDQKENKLNVYLKAVIKDGGYSEAVLCFDKEQQETYDKIFEEIELS